VSNESPTLREKIRRFIPAMLVTIVVLIVLTISSAATNGLTFDTGVGAIGNHEATPGADDLKPIECNSLILTVVANGSGSPVDGPPGGALVIGGSNSTIVNGGSGDDCIIGGTGTTTITGGGGTNVCIGMLGTNFDNATCQTIVTRS
jgi:hypothetical protein